MSDVEKDDLEALFVAARQEQPALPAELTDRILADAAAWQPEQPSRSEAGVFARLLEMLGGWPALGGLATAAAAGLYFGFAQPELVAPGTVSAELSDESGLAFGGIFPDDTLFFEEG